MTSPLTDFIYDLFVAELPIPMIRAKVEAGEYRPVKNRTMRGYLDMSGRK